jgi:hypothetical protein
MAERILEKKLKQKFLNIEFTGPVIELYTDDRYSKINDFIFVRWDSKEQLKKLIDTNCKIINLSLDKMKISEKHRESFQINIIGVRSHKLCTYALLLAMRIIEHNSEAEKPLTIILLKNAGDDNIHEITK